MPLSFLDPVTQTPNPIMSHPDTQAPPLPPRRSPVFIPASLPSTIPNLDHTSTGPPPLPPRSSPSRPARPPPLIPDYAPPASTEPLSGVSVNLTPATPTQDSLGGLNPRISIELAQSSTISSSGASAILPTEARGPSRPTSRSGIDDTPPLSSSRSPSLSHQRWPAPTPAIHHTDQMTTPLPFNLAKDWISWLLLAALLMNLLYARISSFWLLVLAAAYLFIKRPDLPLPAFLGGARRERNATTDEDANSLAGNKMTVEWV